MKFDTPLIKTKFIKRYKRFFVDVLLNKEILTAHCPNSGSMMGLLNEGENAWISESKNTERKLKYTLEILEHNKQKVGVNTHLTNKIVEEALGYKESVVSKAEGEGKRFELILSQYQQNKQITRDRLTLDAVEEVLKGSKKIIVKHNLLPHMQVNGADR